MKIGILSMQRVDNFGSLLQSYSLKKIIESLGNEVSFIDIVPRPEDDVLLGNHRLYLPNEAERKGIIGKLKKIDRYTINRIEIRRTSILQAALFSDFRHTSLLVNNINTLNPCLYDLCVIGSDEVFNCMAPSPWGFTTQLYGDVRNARKVITYAASCGSTSYKMLPTEVARSIKSAMMKLGAISVRDSNTQRFVEKLLSIKADEHLDPVLVGQFDEDEGNIKSPVRINTPYCIIYSYYNRIHNANEIEAIKMFCRRYGMKTLSVGAPQYWTDYYYALTPFEMIDTFKKADFVITDTFHGVVFSYKFSTGFAVFSRKSNENKLLDLLDKLDATDHLINNCNIRNIDRYRINADKRDHLLSDERKRTIDYLKKHIN